MNTFVTHSSIQMSALLNNPLFLEIIMRVHGLLLHDHEVAFMWLLSHVGLAGNVAVDAAAKAPTASQILCSDLKPVITSYVMAKWQKSCDEETRNKLHSIEPKIGSARFYCLPRHDELIIHRLRIGHTHFTPTYSLSDAT